MKDLQRVLLIVANAGSGKTYRLVTRCLELIARGEPPDRILALTFTRKAAAEFLQKLFGRLADAARDPAKLAKLRDELGDPDLTAAQCGEWLRHLTAALPRLAMGTMDGFFGRIVRAFPFELGLGREFRLLDEAGLAEHRRLALDRLFDAAAATKGGPRPTRRTPAPGKPQPFRPLRAGHHRICRLRPATILPRDAAGSRVG